MAAPPTSGQITTTGSAQQIDSTNAGANCVAFEIKAPLTNTGSVFIGPAGMTNTTGHQMDPGDKITYERIAQNAQPRYEGRPGDFWVWIVTNGDRVTWLTLS